MSSDNSKFLFQLLDDLGGLCDEELLGQFTGENVNALKLAAGLLKDGLELDRYLSERMFVEVVRELRELKLMWSRRLGETLNNAGDAFVRGEKIQAMWILDGFIRFCPAPYYRGIAGRVRERYGEE